MATRFVTFLNECSVDDKLLLGGKGANLGELISAGFAVPPGFGLNASCYEDFLSANGVKTDVLRELIKSTDFKDFKEIEAATEQIKGLICNGKIPEDMAEEIGDAYLSLGDSISVAVRSSSAVVGLGISSFPGQMDTFYHVRGIEDVLNHIKLCWASFWNARAASDRWNKGIDHFTVKLSVIVQEMVLSDFSGVAFTANPVSLNRRELVIEAIRGLGEDLVSGKINPDAFLLDRDSLTFVRRPEVPVIPDDLIKRVAETALRIETHYGRPQDIEWSFSGENLYILQSRDIVARTAGNVDYAGVERWNKSPEPDEHEIIWTRAWSDEVLTRAITPLFYSVQAELITRTYDFIYMCYGIKELLPLKVMRFHKNRGYFSTRYLMKCLGYAPKFLRSEDMLKFFTPDQKEEARRVPFFLWKKLWSEIRLFIFHRKFTFTRCHKTYYEDWLPELLARTKELDSLDLKDGGPAEIERYFNGMDRLIKEHCEPIGFGVMVHTLGAITVLEMILKKWLGDNGRIGHLLSGIPGNRTFEANLEIWRLSRAINLSIGLKALFSEQSSSRILAEMNETDEGRTFLERIERFIESYDFRGAEDREISFPRWGDDPTLLVDVLKLLVQADDEAGPEAIERRNVAKREEVTHEILETLSRQRFGSVKKSIFAFLLKYAQIYSLFRENQRYEIDRVFYGERKAFLAAGKRLVQMGVLSEEGDVWFLSKEEVFDALWNRVKPDEVMGLIVPRKAEYRRYTRIIPPMFLQGDSEFDALPEGEIRPESLETSKSLTGVAASPGKATGKARIINSVRELTRIKPGDILVTNSIDPGWSSVFLLIQGLVLETGGVLAHGTVLSREYGLPAVTSVLNATRIIEDGDTVTLDGGLGSVTILAKAHERGITPRDDLRHIPGPEENYSESKWFSFYDEANDVWVSSRMGLEPNKNRANRWLVAAAGGKIIINDLAVDIGLPDENWDDIKAGGLRYRTLKPMSEYGLRFNLENHSAEINWKALTPVFDYKKCHAPLPPSLAVEHYEQSGKVSGTMILSGKNYSIEGTGHRDHSWGVRHWEGFRSWVAFMGHFGPEYFFHLEQFHEQSTGLSWHGFIYRDGENIPIKHVHMDPPYSGELQFPGEFNVRVEDVEGGVADITGKFRFGSPLGFGNCTVMESLGTFTVGDIHSFGIIEYGFTQETGE